MTSVTVLVSETLTPQVCHAARALATAAGAVCGPERVLQAGTAVEFACATPDDEGVRRALALSLQVLQVDAFVLPADERRKRLLVADMDSTIITAECIDELADFAGVKDQVSAVTERAMRGELDFAAALRDRVALLRGLPVATLQQCYEERIALTPGARELVAGMRAHGAHTVLISGGFTFFVERVAREAGFDTFYANELGITDGHLDGTVQLRVDRAAKAQLLAEHAAARGLTPADALAIGDGANDADMVALAGCGVAFRAKPALEAVARHVIRHGDLRAALWLQGG